MKPGHTATGSGYCPNMVMAAESYHRETSQGPAHWPASKVAGFAPMDPGNRPLPFKRYPQAPSLPLPTAISPHSAPAAATLSGRVTADGHGTDTEPVNAETLARLLHYSAGVVRVAQAARDTVWFRAAASAGNLHPLEVYLACGDLPGLGAGLYHFAPDDSVLEQLCTGDCRAALADAAVDPDVANSPVTLIITGVPWRTAWKYAERGWRHLYWDAGTLLANLLAVAEGHRLPARVLLGFVDRELCRLLGLDAVTEFPLAVVTIAAPAAQAPRRDWPEPRLEPTPLSSRPIEFPMITDVQRAGDLGTPEQVAAWRAAPLTSPQQSSAVTVPDGQHDPIEAIILRRSSTRSMRHEIAPPELLHWALAVADRDVPMDAAAGAMLLSHQLAVHEVAGTAPGLHRWSRGGLQGLREGPEHVIRRLSRLLCLDQPLGGDSAYTDFLCADLGQVLGGYGERGYRLAQLQAGLAAGRMQLAAFTLGFGGTGLTFADVQVANTFGTRAACMLAVAIGVPAYRAKTGGLPRHPAQLARV